MQHVFFSNTNRSGQGPFVRQLHSTTKEGQKASRGFEPRSLDSESRVLTVTPRGHLKTRFLCFDLFFVCLLQVFVPFGWSSAFRDGYLPGCWLGQGFAPRFACSSIVPGHCPAWLKPTFTKGVSGKILFETILLEGPHASETKTARNLRKERGAG